MTPIFKEFKCREKKGYVNVKTEWDLCFNNKPVYEYELKYRIYPDGTVYVKSEIELKKFSFKAIELPRFGVNTKVDRKSVV